MKAYILSFLLFLLLATAPAYADYRVYSPNEYSPAEAVEENKRVLFILDFSNSMNEYVNGRRKIDTMLSTIYDIIPTIGGNISLGLRVYGHRGGFTRFDACKASSLIAPIAPNNKFAFSKALQKVKPSGMTPITYSLKQAIYHDFLGYSGKKHIILLTDGGENCDESPCKFAMDLVRTRDDILIDVIAFNLHNQDDVAQLKCTSMVTSGKFYSADNATDLTYSINKSLEEAKAVEAKIIPHY